MKKRLFIFLSLFLLILTCLYLFFYFKLKTNETTSIPTKEETIMINDVLNYVELNFNKLDTPEVKDKLQDRSITVLDPKGTILYSSNSNNTKVNLFEYLNKQNRTKDITYPIIVNDQIEGILVVHLQRFDLENQILLILTIFFILLTLFIITYFLYLYRQVIFPFQKLKTFASTVAKGDLEVPLEMHKTNLFGEFTWSFDLMREELKKAKEKERETSKSKKELVAQLTHDLKTPVATIKACLDILKDQTIDIQNKDKYVTTISKKTDEIHTLIDDLFTSTISELHALSFHIDEYYSEPLLKEFMTQFKFEYPHINILNTPPNVLIKTDSRRLQQVMLNIIQNANKYAKESTLDISFEMEEQFLVITFKDYGQGVDPNDLPFVFKQFYRGKNASQKAGAGLGLYIAKYIMEETEGFITCFNDHGFVVKIGCRMI